MKITIYPAQPEDTTAVMYMTKGSLFIDGKKHTYWFEDDRRLQNERTMYVSDEYGQEVELDNEQVEYIERHCLGEIGLMAGSKAFNITPEQGVRYIKRYGYSGDYYVMVKGYEGDDDEYTEVTSDDLEANNTLADDYYDWQLWRKEGR